MSPRPWLFLEVQHGVQRALPRWRAWLAVLFVLKIALGAVWLAWVFGCAPAPRPSVDVVPLPVEFRGSLRCDRGVLVTEYRRATRTYAVRCDTTREGR